MELYDFARDLFADHVARQGVSFSVEVSAYSGLRPNPEWRVLGSQRSGKLHEADRLIAEGKSLAVVLKTLQVAEQTYYRWRKAYGTFCTLAEAKVVIEDWRTQYNNERPHSSLGYLSPVEFHRAWTEQHQPEMALS